MTKWIRWSGLAVFVLLLLVLIAFYFFAAPWLIKLSVESAGSKALGAKLEVASVSLDVNPLTLTLNQVTAADKDAPMKNLVSLEKVEAKLLFLPLLMGKNLIENVQIDGVAFNTDRQTSGALPTTEQASEATSSEATQLNEASDNHEQEATPLASSLSQSALAALPSAETLLAREPLLTVRRGEQLQDSIASHKTEINNKQQALPTKSDLKQYEKDLKAILTGKFKSVEDFKERREAFNALKARFKADQKAIKAAKKAISVANKDLRQQWPALQNAPIEDVNKIKEKYTLDNAGAQNLTALILGERVNGYVQEGVRYYQKIAPLLASDSQNKEKDSQQTGRFVHFKTDRPAPDFWIKQLTVNLNIAGGDINIRLQDISHQPDVINRPIHLLAKANHLEGVAAFELTAILDYRNQTVKNTYDLAVQGWRITQQPLGISGLSMAQAMIDLTAQGELDNVSLITQAQSRFNQAKFQLESDQRATKEVFLALDAIDTFEVSGLVEGPLTSPSVKINSDLDRQLGQAFKRRLEQRKAAVTKALKETLNTKLLTYTQDYQTELDELGVSNSNMDALSSDLSRLAKSKLASYQDQLKAEAKAKAKAELEKQKEDLKKTLKSLF